MCVFFLLGCKDKAKENGSGKAALAELEKSATEYWSKRFVKRDYGATYEMEAEKGSMSFDTYLKQVSGLGNFRYVDVEFKQAKVDGDRATVSLWVFIEMPMIPKKIKMPLINDSWVLKSNGWKHVFSKGKTQVSPGEGKQ